VTELAHVLFHVGIRKSGTTTLQSHFFPLLAGWAYLGRGAPQFARLHRILKDLVGSEKKGRVFDDDWTPDALTALLEEAGRGCRGVVLSREHLTDAHRGGRTARRLHEVCPGARIVIGIRSQTTAFQSGYSQHVKNGGSLQFEKWVSRVRDETWLHGDVFVRSYQEVFGADAVKVLPFELLVRDEHRYLRELLEFMDPTLSLPSDGATLPRSNPALSEPTVALLRRVNGVLFERERRARKPFRHVRVRPALVRGAETLDRVLPRRLRDRPHPVLPEAELARFEETNARIEDLTGLSLAEYGYPLPASRLASAR
jgi:hypothetical protein